MVSKRKRKKYKFKKNIIIGISLIIISVICIIAYLIINNYKTRNNNENILQKIEIKEEITELKTERMLQLEELRKQNDEIIGWLEISDTNISYPILQGSDNDFYLNHNYKKEKSVQGSLFLDKDFDLINGSSNYLIYGHRMKNGTMFEDLMKYEDEEFYKEHKQIKFTTVDEESTYEVLAVFRSRVYYKKETDVFRYYYFVNANNEEEYNNFINEAKKASLYNTGVDAEYGDQLMTLSTCAYHTENGRFAVVLKKV